MILEDLASDAERIKSVITKSYPQLPIFYSSSKIEMLDYLEQKEDFTLYFLDIFIGKEPLGLEVAQRIIEKNNGLILFTTAYPDAILQEIELQTHTFSIINKQNKNLEKQILSALELALAHSNQQCFVIRKQTQTIFIPLNSILYLEAVKGSGKTLIVAEYGYFESNDLLKNCNKQLDKRFVQLRRTHIVNTSKIQKLDFKNQIVCFAHGVCCPFSLFYAKKNGYRS